MSATTSPSLLLRIRNPEDSDAWEEFTSLYSTIVRRYCFQRNIQSSDIDDITQDVMTRVAKQIRKLDYDPKKGRFRAWFGTVTVNQINTHFAKKKRRSEAVETNRLESINSEKGSHEQYEDPDSHWIQIFSEQVFETACGRVRGEFKEVTWACFEAAWLKNESPQEIAKRFGIRVHTVYVNKSRVLKRLEQEVQVLAEDLPFHDPSSSSK